MRKLKFITLGFTSRRCSKTYGAIKLAQSQGGKAVSVIKISQFINEPWRDVGLDAEKRGIEICKRNGIEKPEANMVMIIGLCDIITKLEQENDAIRADLLLWNEKEVK